MMRAVLLTLIIDFAILSLAAFGGASTIAPPLRELAVWRRHWMSDTEFLQLYAVARAAPGPNILIASAIGWKVAGVVGLLVATAAILLPSSIVCLALGRLAVRYEHTRFVQALKQGLAPVAVGLILASGVAIARAADPDLLAWALTAAGAAWVLFARRNPLWILGLGGGVTALVAMAGR
ncbi:MAG: chromate transporter [Phenylobacterium sp.]|jgi:chromate transporter|nr:chromate transporter [Phenylobacterium sp.]